MQKGRLFTVSAPSGAGKTSLVNALVQQDSNITTAISHTTRTMRPGEVEGQDYYFLSIAQFQEMLAKQAFLEHAEVFGNYYGTSKAEVTQKLANGQDLILEIDWQGAAQIRDLIPESMSIFILPPSKAALLQRLQSRGQDSDAVIQQRMQAAQQEMSHCHSSDYLIVNDEFDVSLRELQAVFSADRLTQNRQKLRYAQLIKALLDQ